MKCPLCKSLIKVEPRESAGDIAKMRKKFAIELHKKGYSFQQICDIVGWKSKYSVSYLLNTI